MKPIKFPKGPLRRNRDRERKRKRKESFSVDFNVDELGDHRDLLQSPPPITMPKTATEALFQTPSKTNNRRPTDRESKMLRNIFSFDQNGKIKGNPFEFIDAQNHRKSDSLKNTEAVTRCIDRNEEGISSRNGTANGNASENEHDSDCEVVVGLTVTPKGGESESADLSPLKVVQNGPIEDSKRNRFNLSIYDGASASTEVTVDDLESMMVERVKLLVWCSSLSYGERVDVIYNPNNGLFERKLSEHGMDRVEVDEASHLMLRLAFSANDGLQKWFIQSEAALLRIKFNKSPRRQQLAFLEAVSRGIGDSNYLRFAEWSYEQLRDRGLLGKSPIPHLSASSATAKWVPFHAVPFVDAAYLVKQRKVLVQSGMAMVPNYLFHLVVLEKFRKFLGRKLMAIRGAGRSMERDSVFQRQIGKIRHFVDGHVLKALCLRPPSLRPADGGAPRLRPLHSEIESKYFEFFPLCTRLIFRELSTKRHIKNSGRLQLSLYLKAIGMPRAEALRFWRKYERRTKYEYSVDYHYVQRDYSSPSCPSIIAANTNSGDCNGCPLKRFRAPGQLLPIMLREYGHSLTPQQIEGEILQSARGRTAEGDGNRWSSKKQRGGESTKYQAQCKRLFAALHLKGEPLVDIEDLKSSWRFPDQYFKMAYSLKNDRQTFDRVFVRKHYYFY